MDVRRKKQTLLLTSESRSAIASLSSFSSFAIIASFDDRRVLRLFICSNFSRSSNGVVKNLSIAESLNIFNIPEYFERKKKLFIFVFKYKRITSFCGGNKLLFCKIRLIASKRF